MALFKFLNKCVTLPTLTATKTFVPHKHLPRPSSLPLKKFFATEDGNGSLVCTDGNKPSTLNKIFRHGYPEELEGAVNHQILSELNASMVYLSMFCYYGRTDIALPGCQIFFRAMYDEEQGHAFKLINYQLMRGGLVTLYPLTVPEDTNWTDITIALGVAIELEKRVKEQLEELIRFAECHKDLQLADFITAEFLNEQNDSICEMGRLLTKAKRLVDTGGVGRHLFDKEVLEYMRGKNPEIKLPYRNI